MRDFMTRPSKCRSRTSRTHRSYSARVARALCFSALVAALEARASVAFADSRATCQSKTMFSPYASHGVEPHRAKAMTFCDEFRAETCCDDAQTNEARARAAHLRALEASAECFNSWIALECAAACDAAIGTSIGVPMCERTCDDAFAKCANDFFALDARRRLVPCRPSDTICATLREWVSDDEQKGMGTCRAFGFDPVRRGSAEWCFDVRSGEAARARSSSDSRSSAKTNARAKSAKRKDTDAMKSLKARLMQNVKANAGVVASGAACVAYLIVLRLVPRMLKMWRRRDGVNAKYAARRAAESRASRSHYL